MEYQICIIGAGFGGLCAAIQLKKAGLKNITIFEKSSDVGGCWFSNKYPGCGCDSSSQLYSFSFSPKSDWQNLCPSQPEIYAYLKNVAVQHDLYPLVKFRSMVKKMTFDEEKSNWNVVVENTDDGSITEYKFRFVISAIGMFRNLNYPEIFKGFSGPVLHTGNWNSEISLDRKNVAVVGCGSSAVQLIPAIVDKVKKLVSYQRNPSWVIPKFNWKLSFVAKAILKIPPILWLVRVAWFWYQEFLHSCLERDTFLAPIGTSIVNFLIGCLKFFQLTDKTLQAQLMPRDKFGCRRIVVTSDLYPALQKPNVELITDEIKEVNGKRIVSGDGNCQKFDVLILATGYHVQEYFSPMEIFGKRKLKVLSLWKKEGPQGLLGTCFSEMPNMFFIYGPGTDNGHNSTVFTIECQTNLIVKLLKHCCNTGRKEITVKRSTVERYMERYWRELEKTIYSLPECKGKSYYYGKSKEVTTLFYGNQTQFWLETRNVSMSDFDFK